MHSRSYKTQAFVRQPSCCQLLRFLIGNWNIPISGIPFGAPSESVLQPQPFPKPYQTHLTYPTSHIGYLNGNLRYGIAPILDACFSIKAWRPLALFQQPCLRLPFRSSRCFWISLARYRSRISGPLTGLRSRINVIFGRCTMHQLKTCFRETVTPTGICLFSLRTPQPEICHCICQLVHVLVLYKSNLDAQVW